MRYESNMHSAFNFVQSVLRNYKWSSEWIERLGWITKTEQTKRERTNELVNWPIRHKCESNGNSVEMPIYFKFYDYFLEFRLWLACTVVRQKRPTNIFYALSFFSSYWMKFVGKIMVPWEGASHDHVNTTPIDICCVQRFLCVHHVPTSCSFASKWVSEGGDRISYSAKRKLLLYVHKNQTHCHGSIELCVCEWFAQ